MLSPPPLPPWAPEIFSISRRVALEEASEWQACFAQVNRVHIAPRPLLVFLNRRVFREPKGPLTEKGASLACSAAKGPEDFFRDLGTANVGTFHFDDVSVWAMLTNVQKVKIQIELK